MPKVLMFHRVLPENRVSKLNAYNSFGTLISQVYLDQVLRCILEEGYQFATVSELLNPVENDKRVALTFDDGYVDNYEFALPVLKKFEATATFFPVVTPCRDQTVLPLDTYYQCVDGLSLSTKERATYINGETKKQFYWADPDEQHAMLKSLFRTLPDRSRVAFMNTNQLKSLADGGFEIGSHGMTHALLTADYMNEERARMEMKHSKQWLETVTGKPVNAYCFPAGRYNTRMIELARETSYTSTCLVVRDQNEREVLPSFDRYFVKPNALEALRIALHCP